MFTFPPIAKTFKSILDTGSQIVKQSICLLEITSLSISFKTVSTLSMNKLQNEKRNLKSLHFYLPQKRPGWKSNLGNDSSIRSYQYLLLF